MCTSCLKSKPESLDNLEKIIHYSTGQEYKFYTVQDARCDMDLDIVLPCKLQTAPPAPGCHQYKLRII